MLAWVWFGRVGRGLGRATQGELTTVTLFLLVYLPFDLTRTRAVGIGNEIASSLGRPVVNIDVFRGNAAGNIVASVSNGCSLSIGRKTAVICSCVNCLARRGGTITKMVGIVLGRSAGALSRIIIMNCNIRGGDSLANTMSSMGSRSVRTHAVAHTRRTLRNGATNIRILDTSTGPNTSPRIHVHKVDSGNSYSPLCMISKHVTDSVNNVSPGSVRSVRILGSNTSTTVCNTTTNGNMMLVAAGGKGKGNGVACSFRCASRDLNGMPRMVGTTRCGRFFLRGGGLARDTFSAC